MKQVILAAALFATPIFAFGQTTPPPPVNSPAEIAAFLARNLSQMAAENDALHAQLADLQKQLAAAQAKLQESPK